MEGMERTDETLYTEWEPETETEPGSRKRMAAAIAGGLAVVVATSTWLFMRGRRKNSRLSVRLPRLKQALKRATDHPERVANASPGTLSKIATTAAATAVSLLTRRMAGRAWSRYASRHPAAA